VPPLHTGAAPPTRHVRARNSQGIATPHTQSLHCVRRETYIAHRRGPPTTRRSPLRVQAQHLPPGAEAPETRRELPHHAHKAYIACGAKPTSRAERFPPRQIHQHHQVHHSSHQCSEHGTRTKEHGATFLRLLSSNSNNQPGIPSPVPSHCLGIHFSPRPGSNTVPAPPVAQWNARTLCSVLALTRNVQDNNLCCCKTVELKTPRATWCSFDEIAPSHPISTELDRMADA